MQRYRITRTSRSGDAHEDITAIWTDTGLSWPTAHAVAHLKDPNGSRFFTEDGYNKAEIGVYRERFLRTHADGVWSNNLLALPVAR